MCKEDACLQNGGVNERLEYADMAYTVRLSVVLPLAGMTGLAIWLCSQYQLGRWVILLGILLGFILAVCSFKNTLKEMEYMEKRRKESHSQKDKKQ